uniref:C-type lectin domain-containing protein n=1 Tax=viral metagenome TaxID=1070528 RepID=A0A6C0BZU9_9ZZZZ
MSSSSDSGEQHSSQFVLLGTYGSYRYYLNEQLKKWQQHSAIAASYQYAIAGFENDAELQAVRNMQTQWFQAPGGSLGHVWIGGRIHSGEWKWQTSYPYTPIDGSVSNNQWQAGFGPNSMYSSGVWGNSSRAQINAGSGKLIDVHKSTFARGIYKELFTPSDVTPPVLSNAALATSGISVASATANDTISLSFEASEPLQSPLVTFKVQNNPIAPNRVYYNEIANNGWTALFVVLPNDTDGDITFVIEFSDLVGNIGVPVQGGGISIDNTAPFLLIAHLSSSNAIPQLAREGDAIVLDIVASEVITQPSVSFSSNTQDLAFTYESLGSGQWRITYIISANDQEGVVVCSLTLTDERGNSREYVAPSLTGGVVVDTTPPEILNAHLNTDNNPDTIAGPGSITSVVFVVDQNIPLPVVSFFAGGVAVQNAVSYSNADTQWTASFIASSLDSSGIITYDISYPDYAGNIGSVWMGGTGSVMLDPIAPNIVSSTISSDGARQNLLYTGNQITLNMQISEVLQSLLVSFAFSGVPVTAAPVYVEDLSNQWTTSYTVNSTDAKGLLSTVVTLIDLAGNSSTSELAFQGCENLFHDTELRSTRTSVAFAFINTHPVDNFSFVREQHVVALRSFLNLEQLNASTAPILAFAYTMSQKRIRRKAVLEACFNHLLGCEEGVLLKPLTLGLELPEGKTKLIAFSPNTVIVEGHDSFPSNYAVLFAMTQDGDCVHFRSTSFPIRKAHIQYTYSATQGDMYTFEGQDAVQIFGLIPGTPCQLYGSFTAFGTTYYLSGELHSGLYEGSNIAGDPVISPLFGPMVTLQFGSENYLLFDNRDPNERLVVNVKMRIMSGENHKAAARNVGFSAQSLRMSFMKYLIIFWKDSWRCFDIDNMAWTDTPTRSKVNSISQTPLMPQPSTFYSRVVHGKKRFAQTCILSWKTSKLGSITLVVSTYPKHPGLRNGVTLRCPGVGDTNDAAGVLVACKNPTMLKLHKPFTLLSTKACVKTRQQQSTIKAKTILWPQRPLSLAEEDAKAAVISNLLRD